MKRRSHLVYSIFPLLLSSVHALFGEENQWPMAAGPYGSNQVTTKESVVTHWSVSREENIVWRRELPEAGLSGIAVWEDKIFLTTNKPLPKDTPDGVAKGSDIVGYCLDSRTGKIQWSVTIPSPRERPFSSLFTDASTPTPVTDCNHVWFINAGGTMACFNLDGDEVWQRSFEARSRHNAKQCQPILVDGQLLYVMMREADDPLAKPMTARVDDRKSPSEHWPWTHLRSFDSQTGQPLWVEPTGTSVHNTPRLAYLDRKPVIYHMRGGGHHPPEQPYGLSLSKAGREGAGECLWSYQAKNPSVYTVSQCNDTHAFAVEKGDLLKIDIRSGALVDRFPLFEKADLRLWDQKTQRYTTHKEQPFSIVAKKFKPEPTNHTPLLVGKHFLFLSHEGHCIGRVHTDDGKVEYLQMPIQVVRENEKEDRILWDSHLPARAENSRGIETSNDKRSLRDGWGHVTCGAPIAVNQYAYFSTMIGMTYVVDATRPVFDEKALISINDLGPAQTTWSLSGPSYAGGFLYHRGLKEVVCIGKK